MVCDGRWQQQSLAACNTANARGMAFTGGEILFVRESHDDALTEVRDWAALSFGELRETVLKRLDLQEPPMRSLVYRWESLAIKITSDEDLQTWRERVPSPREIFVSAAGGND
jgi:hypothetical protein